MKKSIYTVDPAKKTRVLCGELQDGGLFLREVRRSKHFMNVVGGYGIQEDAFQELVKQNCKFIVFREIDTGKNLFSQISTWLDRPKVHIGNYGNGLQRFLGEKYMVTKAQPI